MPDKSQVQLVQCNTTFCVDKIHETKRTSNNVDDMQYKWIYPYCSCLAMSCCDSVLISFIQQNYFQNNHILPIYVCTFGIFRCMVKCMLCCPKISIRICAHYWSFVTKGIMYSHASICNIYTYIYYFEYSFVRYHVLKHMHCFIVWILIEDINSRPHNQAVSIAIFVIMTLIIILP